MGGKLLTSVFGLPEKRIPRAEFDLLCDEILSEIKKDFPDRKIEVIPFLTGKKDFGDIDFLVESKSGENIDWRGYFQSKFDKHNPHVNGYTISIPVRNFQVDFCFMGSETYDTALNYFAAEVGNFMGRTARPYGLRYGHRGLYLQVPLNKLVPNLPDHEYARFLLTKDTAEIHDVLGYDYERFKRGFETKIDLFDWVVSSRTFNSKYFKYENLDNATRVRNKKRPLWTEFLDWIQTYPEKEEKINKHNICILLADRFNIYDQIDAKRNELYKNQIRKSKFNGKIVTEATGLTGPALGQFIIWFKARIGASFWENYLDETSAANIIEHIKISKHEHHQPK